MQALLDAPRETVDANGKAVPTVASGLADAERALLESRGLLNAEGKITPSIIVKAAMDTPEKLLAPALWDAIYDVPKGDVTIEHIQHAFYMAANYGFQILNGNFAAAIDDYELKQRFMNDLATYRIDVSWLWTLVRHQAVITRDGCFQRPALTEDGMVLAPSAEKVKAGARFTNELFHKVWEYHNEWTAAFFAELDRHGDPDASTARRRRSSWNCCSGNCFRRNISSTARACCLWWRRPATRSASRSWKPSSIFRARQSRSEWGLAP